MAITSAAATVPPAMLERLRHVLASLRPPARGARTTAGREETGPPVPGADPPPPAVIFVTVFGLSAAALEDVLDMIVEEGRGRPVSPVFITSSLDFEPFRERRLRFEYLPDGGTRQRFAPDLDWLIYERRRYALLAQKWRPQSLISFGTPPPTACTAVIRSPASTPVATG